MDPISQGVLGGVAAQNRATPGTVTVATLCGVLGGLAPDLDALIRSSHDPLLYLEFHRGFTHALVFIPVGALLVSLALYPFVRSILSFTRTWCFCAVGYATHGLLDACTSYGTQLLWPFSNARVAWHTISIVDPLFTGPLMALVALAAIRRRLFWSRVALLWVAVIVALGWSQRWRAEHHGLVLAESRGHQPMRIEAKPSFGNLLVWKNIYEYDGRFYVDAIRLGTTVQIFPGTSIAKLEIKRDLPWLVADTQQARDIERFRWFSSNYLALDSRRKNFIVDMRYSMLPDEIEPLWGIQLDPRAEPGDHVEFRWDRKVTASKRHRLLAMLKGD